MAKTKGVPVQATIDPDLNKFLEDHKWDVRKTRSELVAHALGEYAKTQGYQAPTELAEAPAADAT